MILLLDAAQQAAGSADWAAVRQAATDCLDCMTSVASNPDLSVRALLLQAEAHHKLHQFSEALQASLDGSASHLTRHPMQTFTRH